MRIHLPRLVASGVAVKRLAEVEVRPQKSNQHEFNAGALRTALGISDARLTGTITFFSFSDSTTDPAINECDFTLYDARRHHPTRREYRLYYSSSRFSTLAKAGDLLVVFRRGPGVLGAIIAAAGSEIERRLEIALELGNDALERFIAVSARSTAENQRELFEAMTTNAVSMQPVYEIRSNPLFKRAVFERRIPPTYEMAVAAQQVLANLKEDASDPDAFLFRAMEIETDLFFAIEESLGSTRLEAMLAQGQPPLNEFLSFAMSIQQARKSRRGQSLQNHFGELLKRCGIPHSAQSETEPGEVPDFLMPSQAAYRNEAYPVDALRMIACKSTVRDRWRQILKEAQRIQEKYLLTLDANLTPATLNAMKGAKLRVFIPRPVIEAHYVFRPKGSIHSVQELLDSLRIAMKRAPSWDSLTEPL